MERLAFNALGMQAYDKACRYLERIADRYPKVPGVHYNYAVGLIGAGRQAEALRQLLIELSRGGERYEVLKALGELCYRSGRRSPARSYLRGALGHCADEAQAGGIRQQIAVAESPSRYTSMLRGQGLFQEACRFQEQGDWHQARALLFEALECDGTNALIFNNLGVIAMNHEQAYETAERYFEESLKHAELPLVRRNLARAAFLRTSGRQSALKGRV